MKKRKQEIDPFIARISEIVAGKVTYLGDDIYAVNGSYSTDPLSVNWLADDLQELYKAGIEITFSRINLPYEKDERKYTILVIKRGND